MITELFKLSKSIFILIQDKSKNLIRLCELIFSFDFHLILHLILSYHFSAFQTFFDLLTNITFKLEFYFIKLIIN
jgi:hypothetical protein